MNATRIRAIEDGQSGTAKKVLAAVPIKEDWTIHQIGAEMRRLGWAPNVDVIERCLMHFIEQKIVRKVQPDTYQRTKVAPPRPEPMLTREPVADPPVTPLPVAAAPAPQDPFDRAAALVEKMDGLLREFSEVTLAMQERVEQARAESAKFRRLQELLRE